MRFVDSLAIYASRMSPALNGSSAIRRFERSDAIEILNGITFDFYTGLSHISMSWTSALRTAYELSGGIHNYFT